VSQLFLSASRCSRLIYPPPAYSAARCAVSPDPTAIFHRISRDALGQGNGPGRVLLDLRITRPLGALLLRGHVALAVLHWHECGRVGREDSCFTGGPRPSPAVLALVRKSVLQLLLNRGGHYQVWLIIRLLRQLLNLRFSLSTPRCTTSKLGVVDYAQCCGTRTVPASPGHRIFAASILFALSMNACEEPST